MFASIPADDDYISPTLPRELVERILFLLDAKYVLTCRLVNSEFNEIIQSSTLLQYFLACEAAGVIDNPRSPLSYGERLEALLKREDAWRTLKPVFETTIKVNHEPYVIYGLTEGAFFLDDRNLKDLHYCLLPSSSQDNPRWNRIQSHGIEEGNILKFATAVYEHDLIIKVVSSDIGNQADTPLYSLDLILLKFSTGEYHPLARHPRIHIQKSPEARPRVKPGIVGDNFALIVQVPSDTFEKLFIFDWKTGYKRLQHETTGNPHSDLVFVSPEILLVLNPILWHFEVWHLPPSHPNPKPPVQILALQIPAISRDHYWLVSIGFDGKPNPFLHSVPYFPPRPFFPSRENSIIITSLWLESLQDTRSDTSYSLIMPRRALLDTIQKWTSPSLCEQIEALSIWFTEEVTVYKIVDPDGLVRLEAQSKLVSIPLPRPSPRTPGSPTFGASPTSPTSHISTHSNSSSIHSGSSTTSSTTQYNFPQVKWADWGPPISRWFQENEERWIMGSTGQRYAFWAANPRDKSKLMVSVADFNQNNVRRNMDMMARLRAEGKNHGANDNNEKEEQVEEEELERLDHDGVFLEDIYMGLKCMIYHAPDEYDFTMGLMDEQRLLGLNVNNSNVESVQVLHFG